VVNFQILPIHLRALLSSHFLMLRSVELLSSTDLIHGDLSASLKKGSVFVEPFLLRCLDTHAVSSTFITRRGVGRTSTDHSLSSHNPKPFFHSNA